MLLRLLVLMLMFVFHGCTAPVNSQSLLSKYTECKENCTSGDSSTISGELSILPDEGEIYSSPEGSDLVEVTGSCKDLGRKANRILVQVYEGEDDSVQPIIDNSIDVNCQSNISTTSLQSPTSCLIISQGIGLADSGNSTSQFPQCFNGRFSFQIRVGRIIRRDTNATASTSAPSTLDSVNPRVRYLVKMKLRTTEGSTNDSGAATMVINRALAVPTFSVTANQDYDRCEIKMNPSKFRDTRYTLYTTWTGPSWAASGSITNTVSETAIYVDKQPTFPPLGNGTTVENFYHTGQPIDLTIGLMPGVTYSYRMESGDYSFRNTATPALTDYEVQFGNTAGNVERSAKSGSINCVMDPAYVRDRTEQNQGSGTPNSCLLSLAGYNNGYSIEWRVASSPTWVSSTPNAGFLVSLGGDTATNCRALPTCFVHGDRSPATFPGSSSATTYIDGNGVAQRFQPNVPYYFAARHYRDTNGNGLYDSGIDQLAGEWSPPTNVTGSSDYNHRCTFNTYPAQ